MNCHKGSLLLMRASVNDSTIKEKCWLFRWPPSNIKLDIFKIYTERAVGKDEISTPLGRPEIQKRKAGTVLVDTLYFQLLGVTILLTNIFKYYNRVPIPWNKYFAGSDNQFYQNLLVYIIKQERQVAETGEAKDKFSCPKCYFLLYCQAQLQSTSTSTSSWKLR